MLLDERCNQDGAGLYRKRDEGRKGEYFGHGFMLTCVSSFNCIKMRQISKPDECLVCLERRGKMVH